jgi:hypothetical protein
VSNNNPLQDTTPISNYNLPSDVMSKDEEKLDAEIAYGA